MKKRLNPTKEWAGRFGDDYIDRNACSVDALNEEYLALYGFTRESMNDFFLSGYSRPSVLEVGCNVGTQLFALRGRTRSLTGVDVNQKALDLCHKCIATHRVDATKELPFPDNTFDVVMVNGLLIHIPPAKLGTAISELGRVCRGSIIGLEYYAEEHEGADYRGNEGMMWRGPFPTIIANYLTGEGFWQNAAVKEKRLERKDGTGVDVVFRIDKI